MKDQANLRLHAIKDPLVGTTVDGRFRILAAIGQGATSSVYKADEVLSGRLAAIKILHPHLAADQSLVARFAREAQAAKILKHPNIIPVSEYAVSDQGTPYLVMEYVDGISLQQLLARDGWLSVPVAIAIFTQICAGLNEAHQKGVVHRDIKPGNIMLVDRPDGQYLVKILDFGCAQMMPMLGDTVLKVTQTGEMLGSLLYMSPEQCLDGEVDGRSDCYSLGCVLYESLTGKPPLAARTAFETMNKQLSEMPDSLQHTRPDLVFSKELERIIFKAMAKSPARRFQKITDFMDGLSKCSQERFAPEKKGQQAQLRFAGDAEIETLAAASILNHSLSGERNTVAAEREKPNKSKDAEHGNSFNMGLQITSARFVGIAVAAIFAGVLLCLPMSYMWICFAVIGLLLMAFGTLQRKTTPYNTMIRRGKAQIEPINNVSAAPDPQLRVDSSSPFIPALRTQSEITIYSAERRSDGSIALDIAVQSSPRQGVTIRPLESRSFFWQTLCDGLPNDQRPSEFPIKGQVLNIENVDATYIVIEKHLALLQSQL
jgi:serine/threonine protein kinase